MRIDIRNFIGKDTITEVQFDDSSVLCQPKSMGSYVLYKQSVRDNDPPIPLIRVSDIDNLIKALEYAKKIWS